jgi:zinc carboxypeptidase
MKMHFGIFALSAFASLSLFAHAQTIDAPDGPFFADASYDQAIPKPDDLLGYALGSKATTASEVEKCITAWAKASDRAQLVEYARSYEDRPLHYIIISDPANLSRLDTIKENLASLGDPRALSDSEINELIDQTPPVAWLAYTIHGDETEGSDAALAILYHLLADTGDQTRDWLRDMIIIIDPLMNPDGRDRFLKMVAEQRGTLPNYDDRSAVHMGYWPYGRGNHYLFDLNRDWILAIHPETRGRIQAIRDWNPLLLVDAHGMGAQNTHLFSPPREPINPNIPKHRLQWGPTFASDQALRFDQQGWLYYTGEWHEEWYPGYTDAWASYRGAIGILYEQARVAENGVRRPGGQVLSYRESVHHHVAGSMANLATLHENRLDLWKGFVATRQQASAPDGPYANRIFAVPPTPNKDRWRKFTDLMALQGFEMHLAGSVLKVPNAIDQVGRQVADLQLPAESLLISNRQPLGHLLAAMLEFDPKLSESVLHEERKEVLARGQSKIYDTTAWNLTMMYDLQAYMLPMELPQSATAYSQERQPEKSSAAPDDQAVAMVIDGADDRSVTAAGRLMRAGIEVRISRKTFELQQQTFPRGSVVVTQSDQRGKRQDWRQVVRSSAAALDLKVTPVTTGLGLGDLPDLGGKYFVRLEPPRVAMVMRGHVDGYDYGSIWHLLDHQLHLPHSQLNLDRSSFRSDLSRYNVLVLPNRWYGDATANSIPAIEAWVRSGGTLIAIGSGTNPFTEDQSKLSQVRRLENSLDKLDEYELAIWREWMAGEEILPQTTSIWSNRVGAKVSFPWTTYGGSRADEAERKRRDDWQRLFMPAGALVAARVDPEHWLTAGCVTPLPLMIRRGPVLMSKPGTQTAVRLGFFVPGKPAEASSAEGEAAEEAKEKPRSGWAVVPPGNELYLRMSGLLWPEAAQRLANAAYLTRESVGSGQVILFADSPNFRSSTLGTARLLMNALVYGPGFGARQPIRPIK